MNNLLSFSSVKVHPFTKDGEALKPASGFVLESGSRFYLVTNWHVLSGRDFVASKSPEPFQKPYMLKIVIHINAGESENTFPLAMGMRQRITIPLYEDQNAQTWLECREKEGQTPRADLAVRPLQLNQTIWFEQMTRLFKQAELERTGLVKYWSRPSAIPVSAIDTDVEYNPPDAVHVIGYPHHWTPEGKERSSSAFWRTSFIASELYEPGMNRSHLFFIDPPAPEGMTGSPVVGIKKDRVKLLGIYSDPFPAEYGVDAGFVWDARLLKDLIGAS